MDSLGFSKLEIQFLEALALIAMACVAVPVFKRIGLGSILGYIAAGVIVGATLTLGFTDENGAVVLVGPSTRVPNGGRLH